MHAKTNPVPAVAGPLALLLAAASVQAQTPPPVVVTATLSWQEVNAQGQSVPTPNGFLEPGESARLSISIEMSPAVMSFVQVTSGQVGTLRGFGSMYIDLVSTGDPSAAVGDWTLQNSVPIEWDLVGGWGTPESGGAVLSEIVAAQFPFGLAQLNPTNPIQDIWHGSWTPSDYTARQVPWDLRQHPAGSPMFTVCLQNSPFQWLHAYASSTWSPVTIPIVPAPSSAVLLFAGALLATRRRRVDQATRRAAASGARQ